MSTAIGQSGTLFSAVLESMGYVYQSHILNVMAPLPSGVDGSTVGGMFGAAAAFIFVVALIIIGMQYLYGDTKKWTWYMLIAPTLFYLAIIPRVEVENTIWKFPKSTNPEADNKSDVEKFKLRSLGEDGRELEASKVSSLFAEYNKMTSIVVNWISEQIIGSIEDLDRKFIRSIEKINDLQLAKLSEEGADQLFSVMLMRDCREYFQLASKAYGTEGAQLDEQAVNKIKKQLEEEDTRKPILFKGRERAANYVTRRLIELGDAFAILPREKKLIPGWGVNNVNGFIGELEREIYNTGNFDKKYNEVLESQIPACSDVWELAFLAVHIEAYHRLDKTKEEDKQQKFHDDFAVDLYRTLKLTEEEKVELTGLSEEGKRQRKREFMAEKLKEDPKILYGLIARHVFANQIAASNASGYLLHDHKINSHLDNLEFADASQEFDYVANMQQARGQYTAQYKVMMHALQLPYYQGVILFFLSILYPFFALMLLFPGKYVMFIHWFLYWLWAKSWDIGFAMIMIIDRILFDLIGVGKPPLDASNDPMAQEIKNEMSNKLELTLASMKYVNPGFDYFTYYMIISTAIASIPVISGVLILRSSPYLCGIVGGAINSFSSTAQDAQSNVYAQKGSIKGSTQMAQDVTGKIQGLYNSSAAGLRNQPDGGVPELTPKK